MLRDLSRNWIRTLLTCAGIALGVAVMLAINMANGTALSRFRESIDLVAGKSNLEIHGTTGGELDQKLLTDLQWLWDQDTKFTPVIDEVAVLPAQPPELLQVIGVDVFADPEFRSFSISGGKDSRDSASEQNLSIFNRNSVYIGTKLAEQHKLRVGDKFNVLINDRTEELQVVGIIAYTGPGKAFGGSLLVMDIGPAQQLFDMHTRISRIDLLAPAERLTEIQSAVAKVLPASTMVAFPERRGQQVQKMIASFQYNLGALSLIALLVGMFVIYNTMSMTVIRKRPEIGTLRALGASKSLIFSLFTLQSIFIGAVGSALGVLLGTFFARGAVKAVGSTIQSLYVDQPRADVVIDPVTLLTAFAAGLTIAIAAALGPVFEAMSVPPAEATRRASYELRIARSSGRFAQFGLGLLVLAGLASQAPALNGFPVFGYVAAALTIFGVALIMPLSLGWLMVRVAGPASALLGSEGKLAVLSLTSTLGRTSVTVASLTIGIAMMISLAVMIGSFRQTVITWVNQTLKADLYISPLSRQASNRGRLDNETVERIRSTPGVADVDAFVEIPIEYNGNPTNLGAGDSDVLARRGNLLFLDRRDPREVLAEVENGKSCIITESFALRNNVKIGDVLNLPSKKGTLRVRVADIYYDYASDLGYVIIPRSLFREHFDDYYSTTVALYAEQGTPVEEVRGQLLEALGTNARVNIRSNRELRTEILRIFDNTFAITYALHAIAILVAILGVMNALFALTYEMRRDFAILRYVGASLGQLRKLVLVQAGILGLLGNLCGLGVGLVLSLLLIHVINKQSFGWTVQLAIPVDFILQSSALVLLFALLSGILPAYLAVRNISPEAVRYE